ncbi:PilW family protein [Lysobacter koreensis]|uniref:PilW family protein n=1 Tax=Lysobacter koreensis TaxID=266122 RepID=A0ABW2YM76_9GAMM
MSLNRRRAAGVSLIELMVALLIGTILMLGLIEVFAGSRAAYQTSEGLARVQENSRFALDYLQRDIRMIGHYGCANDQSHKQQVGALVSTTGAAAGGALDFNLSVQGFEANGTTPGDTLVLSSPTAGWTPGLPAHISALGPLPGSDVIMLRFLRGNGAAVTNIAIAGSTTTFTVGAANWGNLTQDGVATPDLFAVSDCSYVNIFPGTGNSAAGTATAAVAIERYTPQPTGQAALYRAEAVAYYVANGASGRPALWRARWNSAGVAQPEELVDGIENLQLIFGQDQSADVNSPTGFMGTQNTAGDAALGVATDVAGEQRWRRVGLVQVGLLASSANPSAAQAPAAASRPSALGVTYSAPADGRFRTAYESTIALRNRLYGN